MYQNLFKEGNGDHKFLKCAYLLDNNFDILPLTIALYKAELECTEIVKAKPTRNYSGFITYSNTINFSVK